MMYLLLDKVLSETIGESPNSASYKFVLDVISNIAVKIFIIYVLEAQDYHNHPKPFHP